MARQRREYPNGYLPKIVYWQGQLIEATLKDDAAAIARAKSKLEYFEGRQAQLDEA
jgi:hypothetical protein